MSAANLFLMDMSLMRLNISHNIATGHIFQTDSINRYPTMSIDYSRVAS